MKKQMIRVIALLLVLLLVGGILASVALAAPEDRSVEIASEAGEGEARITSAQVIGDTLYLVADGALYALAPGAETPEKLSDLAASIGVDAYGAILASDGETLYILKMSDGTLYTWDGAAATEVVQLDFDGLGEILEDGALYVNLVTPVVADGSLLVLYQDPADYYTMPLLRFSLADGRYERVSGTPALRQLAAYKDGQLLGVVFDYLDMSPDSKPMVVAIDAKTGLKNDKTGDIAPLATYYDGGVAYDAATDTIYAVSASQVVRVAADGLTPVNYLSGSYASGAMYAGVLNGEYVMLSYDGLSVRGTDPSQMPENPLRIMGPSVSNNLVKDFIKDNPDIAVLESGEFLYETDALTTSILSGTDAADIYLLMSYTPVQDLIAKGYMDPLDSEVIREDVFSMYPQIQDLVTKDGQVYGVPLMLSTTLWSVREDLLEEFGYEMPKSLKEYYEMMIQWDEDYADDNTDYTFDNQLGQGKDQARLFAISTAMQQYAMTYEQPGEPLTFDTPAFRDMLAVLEQLPYEAKDIDQNAAAVSINVGEEQKQLFNSYSYDPLGRYYRMSDSDAPPTKIMAPPPFAEGDDPQFMVYSYFYVLNPNSKNKEQAMRFLEYAAQHRDVEAQYLMHPDLNDLPEIENYEQQLKARQDALADAQERLKEADPADRQALEETIERLEAMLADTDSFRWEFSAEALANYRELAPHMNFMQGSLMMDVNNTDGNNAINQLVMRYLSGQEPMDKMLKELDGIFMKMYQERR